MDRLIATAGNSADNVQVVLIHTTTTVAAEQARLLRALGSLQDAPAHVVVITGTLSQRWHYLCRATGIAAHRFEHVVTPRACLPQTLLAEIARRASVLMLPTVADRQSELLYGLAKESCPILIPKTADYSARLAPNVDRFEDSDAETIASALRHALTLRPDRPFCG